MVHPLDPTSPRRGVGAGSRTAGTGRPVPPVRLRVPHKGPIEGWRGPAVRLRVPYKSPEAGPEVVRLGRVDPVVFMSFPGFMTRLDFMAFTRLRPAFIGRVDFMAFAILLTVHRKSNMI